MEQKLEKFSKLNYITILFLGYFLIPGALKYPIHGILFRYEEIFLALGILSLSFLKYKNFNYDQKKLFVLCNLLLIFINLINILYFYLIGRLSENYLIFKLLHGYIYFFSLLNFFLIIFYFNKKTELFLKIIYFTGIFLTLEFLFFIFLSDYFSISEIIYKNTYFEFNSNKYPLFRSIFIGDHITTSVWAFISLFAGFSKKNKSYLDYIIFFLLILITFLNFESRLNFFNSIFCIGIFLLVKFLKINLNLKKIFGLITFYFLSSISISLFLYYSNINLINLNSFSDRMVLNIFNFDTFLTLPINLGFNNLQLHYIENKNILLKEILFLLSSGGNGIGTIASLGSNYYFYLWNTITAPHNILMTYFSSMGFWFILFIILFNRLSSQNFKFNKILLIMIFNIVIFSFWNQIWHIDILFILLIALIMNEGLKNEKS